MDLDLKVIASVSGKQGLYRIIKPTRTGLIVETLDDKKMRTAIGANSRVSVLKEVSMYTLDAEGSAPLAQVLLTIFEKYPQTLPVTNKSSETELFDFLKEILPHADTEKIYQSDLKKLVTWYDILLKYAPEVLQNLKQTPNEETPNAEETPTDTTTETQEEN